jgi:hypothetical protein
MNKSLLILKSNGAFEPFNKDKLMQSLLRSGARPEHAEQVVAEVASLMRGGETSGTIYYRAFEALKKINKGVAARYTMRRALSELGPTGFPFERFIAAVFASEGYTAASGIYLEGRCVSHEVDLLATNHKKVIIGELKFHNRLEVKSDLKVALYVQSRFEDLKAGGFRGVEAEGKEVENWLVTNTKFTTQAITYAKCNGINLLGWSYPDGRNLELMIQKSGLEPLTMLTSLSLQEKQSLMQDGHVLCRLITKDVLKDSPYIQRKKIDHILDEVQLICSSLE